MNKQPEALRLHDALLMGSAMIPNIDLPEAAAELRRLYDVNQELLGALEKLARLGNGEHYGNSVGNMIARAAIAKATGETE